MMECTLTTSGDESNLEGEVDTAETGATQEERA